MKKFLSLVLAMIMTMSLVTISAGATEYKDLTDKDEIKYEEAVAVLNRIGVITGYSDGSFQPETELTRGAAAKIIVSLMIGPDAAAALPNTSSPYPDVPAGHTFAGVIGFCKTKGYISGYGDGNFKPAGTLTGYAFAKMLLGALGYSSDIERFTGAGWTMNVANIGNVAGLFDRISFDGAAAVTRDEACQLALNTLKATMVTYGGTSVVNGSTGSYTIQGTQATPKTSNNRDINANIGRKDWYGGNNKGSDYLTLEFGEEHFKDLRLEHDRFDPAHDDFGRPSNEWSYKKVTIGTFPLEADYTFTTQVAHIEDTDGTKEKALGLRNFDLVSDGGYSTWNGWGNDGRGGSTYGGTTTLWLNGLEDEDYFSATKDGKLVRKVANIADFTDNGTLVEVYVSNVDADWITDVVVIQTQLMEVKKVGSDYISLEKKEPDALKNNSPRGTANIGFNLAPIEVNIEQVKDSNEDCYGILKDLKSGDEIAVIPVTTDNGKTYEAAEVYVPETVSGALTRVDTYGIGKDSDDKRGAVEITVGGTSYKLADWNDEMWALKTEDIKATRKDVTLLMDKYGNALLAKDVGATNDFMVIGNYYQALVGNKVCTFVHGWDISGNELDLNLGSNVKITNHGNSASVYGHVLGELVYYTSVGASGNADYVLAHQSGDGKKTVNDVFVNLKKTNSDVAVPDKDADYEIKASNLLIPLVEATGNAYGDTNEDPAGNGKTTHKTTYNTTDFEQYYYDKGVKFIYVNYVAGEDEIDSIEFKSGVQNVSNDELRQAIQFWGSQAAVKDEQVKAVVIKRESADASVNRMLYVTKTLGFKEYDKESNESFYEVEVAMFSDGKFETEQHIIVNKDLQIGDFATYTKVSGTKYEDNYYRVKQFVRHNANPAVLSTDGVSEVLTSDDGKVVKHLMKLSDTKTTTIEGKALRPDSGDDGVDAPMNVESYVLGGYRGSSTTVPNTVGSAKGIIRTDKAEWLNATRDSKWDDINSAEDLFDETDGNVKLDILLNEKPDADGFRTAYLIVLKEVNGTSGGSNSSTVKGSSWTATTKVNKNGYILYTLTVNRPDWVPADASVGLKTLVGELLVDGVKVQDITPVDFVYDKKTGTLSTYTTSPFAEDDGDITIRVTDIEWEKVKVETKGDTSLVATAPAETIAVGAYKTPLSFTVKRDCGNGKAIMSQNGEVLDTKEVKAGSVGPYKFTVTAGTEITTKAPVVVTFELNASTVPVEAEHTVGIEAPETVEKTGTDKANYYVDSIKEWDRGVYEAPSIPQDVLGEGNPMYRGGNDVANKDCIVIVFPKTGKAESYTLQIDGSDSVYKEVGGPATAGSLSNAFFHVQVNDNYSTHFANGGDEGDMKEAALAAGKHTYSITGSLSGTIQTGEFEITKKGMNEVVTPSETAFTMPSTGADGVTGATQEEKDNACKDFIKSLEDGVYETPNFTGTSIGMLQSNNYDNTRLWKVKTANGGESITIELFMGGKKVFGETVRTSSAATTVFFLVDVAGGSNSTDQTIDWTSGSLIYRITGSESGVMLQGTLNK